MGEHTWEVCRDVLGMGAEEFEQLKAEGAF